LERPDRGQILFRGQDITYLSEEDLIDVRKQIAYVFQYGALFDSLTIEENLSYPLREHTPLSEKAIQKKVKDALAQVGLDGSQHLTPGDLSGGMQRRVGVARSIIMGPEVILYDEPTTGLDPYNTRQIMKIILELKKQGATSVLVTHDMSAIFAVTDRVAFLKAGKIRALGTAEEIRSSRDSELHGFIHGETM
jgi:phospholipid/cholesterol/gamma-HCH transport system ATP-binding protein